MLSKGLSRVFSQDSVLSSSDQMVQYPEVRVLGRVSGSMEREKR